MAIDFVGQRQRLLDLCIQIQQIAAPTGAEDARARWVADRLRYSGFQVDTDDLANVYACVRGERRRPALLVSAHIDTVFPASVDLTVRQDQSQHRIYGPGIGDNSVGVAALLWLAEQLVDQSKPPVDIWLVANSGEEGNGDLRGMRGAVDRLQGVLGASIVIEGMGLPRVVNQGLGSRRYRIEVTAPGGHSWSDYGSASAVHVLSQLAADLTRLKPPSAPRTTFNIGVIDGGTSVNSIAQRASLELDLRSEEPAALALIVDQVKHIVARYQSARWQQSGVTVRSDVIGDRPCGAIEDDHPLVLAALQSLAAVGVQPQNNMRISSTDANIPLSRGIPAVCIGVTDGGNAHRLDEWITPEFLPKGMQHVLALTSWAVEWLEDNEGK